MRQSSKEAGSQPATRRQSLDATVRLCFLGLESSVIIVIAVITSTTVSQTYPAADQSGVANFSSRPPGGGSSLSSATALVACGVRFPRDQLSLGLSWTTRSSRSVVAARDPMINPESREGQKRS